MFKTGFEKISSMKQEDWQLLQQHAIDNPMEGILAGGMCFIASMGMDMFIGILRWGGVGLMLVFGFMLFQQKKEA